jgi:5-methylthioadenosine/S-adenosylhomocysteine deaminase|tara:strand:+ start:2827 stop:4152 length:1326 start_codon:yes stop_codon:yes gene_type:complete
MDSSLQSVDNLISARWVIPVVPRDTIYDNYSVAVSKNQIMDVLPSNQAIEKYRPDTVTQLDNHVLIPGLINTHGHAAMTLLRGHADDLSLEDWLNDHIWPLETKWVDFDFVRDGTTLAIAEMLRSGTTCFSEHYYFPDAAAEAMLATKVRAQLCLPMVQFPSAWAKDEDEYLHKGLQVHDDQRNNDLIRTAFGPHSPHAVSDELLHRIMVLSEELDIPVHIHLHETSEEVSQAMDENGKRPLQRLAEIGLLSPRLQAVHMTQVTEEEIALLAANAVNVVHCPESNLKLASGFCPVSALLQGGVNVALGTDGAASNNDLDMFSEMKTAALMAKAVAVDATVLDAHTALRLATLNGARAMGLAEQLGSLEAGKLADLVAVDLSQLESQPVYNPLSQLLYAQRGSRVSHVWVNGEVLLEDGQFTHFNPDPTIEAVQQWRDKLRN